MLLFFAFVGPDGERYVELVTASGDPAAPVHLWLLDRAGGGCSGLRSLEMAEAIALVRSGTARAFKQPSLFD